MLLAGCTNLNEGSILGALTYHHVDPDPSILVRNGFVALYASANLTQPIAVLQTDALGRFNFTHVQEGAYVLAGSLTASGPFTGATKAFGVPGQQTARVIFAIDTPPPGSPTVTAVSPTGPVGAAGASITFTATADQSPTRWAWDFSTGATPQNSTDASPVVTLGGAGDYTGTVTASNATGTSLPFSFSYMVAAAP